MVWWFGKAVKAYSISQLRMHMQGAVGTHNVTTHPLCASSDIPGGCPPFIICHWEGLDTGPGESVVWWRMVEVKTLDEVKAYSIQHEVLITTSDRNNPRETGSAVLEGDIDRQLEVNVC